MRTELIRDLERFMALKDRWDDLVSKSRAGTFLTHGWLTAWWRAFCNVDELRVLCVWEGDALRAAWPLHLRAPRTGPLRVRALRVLGDLGGPDRAMLCHT